MLRSCLKPENQIDDSDEVKVKVKSLPTGSSDIKSNEEIFPDDLGLFSVQSYHQRIRDRVLSAGRPTSFGSLGNYSDKVELDTMPELLSVLPMSKEQSKRLQRIVNYNEFVHIQVEEALKEDENCLSMSELAELKDVFRLFDTDDNGMIDLKELTIMCTRLGQPLTEQDKTQAEKMFSSIKGLNFDDFLRWWLVVFNDEGKKKFHIRNFLKGLEKFEPSKLSTTAKGEGLEYRLRFFYDGKQISPWHDIPLYSDSTKKWVNFICEIPKWTRAKYEIATKEQFNPIKQDVKNGKPRFYKHGDMMFNYGALPQTWEDPKVRATDMNVIGDNDPLDALEVGIRQMKSGEIAPSKVLGVLALVDDGECDWKLILLKKDDLLSQFVNSLEDLERYQPGSIRAIREYLRIYKVCTGKPENEFGYKGECKDEKFAHNVIEETHEYWEKLVTSGHREVQ